MLHVLPIRFNLFQQKEEFQDETSEYDNMVNCSDWNEKAEDHFASRSSAVPKQLSDTGDLNQQRANIKLENDDELPYTRNSAWNCNESNAKVSSSMNRCGTNEGNMIHDSKQVTSTKHTSWNESEGRSRGDMSMKFRRSRTTSVFKSIGMSYREPQQKMKEKNKTLKSNFSSRNAYVNRVQNESVTSEMNENPQKQHTCHLCFQSYAGRSGLWQHLQKHSGRLYICKVCNKQFTRGNALKQHERSHSKDSSNITCQICKKILLNVVQQRRHVISHFIDWSNAQIRT